HFYKLAPSYRRNYIGWIMDAKQVETKLRRLGEAINMLSKGEKLGMK
ncbi:MAG: YdeI/OmpD-associated family protein, partial [Bacteroidales bacterium]|nr:YdeI/OmpD-associated family protein [Bacteroidales bacterium]